MKYYLMTKVFLTAISSIAKIRNLSISSELFYILMNNMYSAKKCNLDLSVEWFKLWFRSIKLTAVSIA